MVRDQWMRILFIPLLGVFIPFFSGAVTYPLYTWAELVVVHLYFAFVSLTIWLGCHWIHGKLRRMYPVKDSPYGTIFSVCLVSGLYGSAISCLLFFIWSRLSREVFSAATLFTFMALSACAVIIFTLLYEVLYLSREKELERSRVDQLDKEKTLAELQALHNELDPHFIFNSLTALSYLIRNDADKALQFDQKLAQVFRYFLVHRNQSLVTIEQELAFVRDYFYLLQIRHDDKLRLQITGRTQARGFVVPCSLQLLIENAIKHNAFSSSQPLCITIELHKQTVCVRNNLQPVERFPASTKIGLTNLSQQYRLVCQQTIVVEKTESEFLVYLPISTRSSTSRFSEVETPA